MFGASLGERLGRASWPAAAKESAGGFTRKMSGSAGEKWMGKGEGRNPLRVVVASGNGVSLAGVEIARKLGVSPTTVSPILRVLVFQEALLDQVIMDWDVPVPVGLRRVAPDPEDVDAALEVDVLGTGHGDLVAEPACTRGSPTENGAHSGIVALHGNTTR
jgi:hypothetical protein